MADNDLTAGRPQYAIIHVSLRPGSDEWPIVERVPDGWQSGAHHYPDADVLDVELLNPPAPRARSIVALAARVRGARIADYINLGTPDLATPTNPTVGLGAVKIGDPRETEHMTCDCVPHLGPPHCHVCTILAGREVPWDEAHPTAETPLDLDAIRARVEAAHQVVVKMCEHPLTAWHMSIPARPDRDSDLVIEAALIDTDALVAEVERLRQVGPIAWTFGQRARAERAEAEVERLRAGYAEAIEDIDEWGAYASGYFKEKWDLDGCLARHRATLANRPGEAS